MNKELFAYLHSLVPEWCTEEWVSMPNKDRVLLLGVLKGLQILNNNVTQLRKELMATQADLDAGIAQETADTAALTQAVIDNGNASSKAFADLEAKIAANPGAPVSDFSEEVAALAAAHSAQQTALTNLAAATAAATAADGTTETAAT